MDQNTDREPWNWHGGDFRLQKDSNFDGSSGLWDEVALNEEDISYMFDETTPVKDCADFAHHVTHCDNMSKEPEEQRETSSQVKRRRMLQFDNILVNSSHGNDEMSSAFLKSSERENSLEEALPVASQWISGFSEASTAMSYEGLDESSERWLAECFNDTDMHGSPDDMNFTGASEVLLDISEFCHSSSDLEAGVVKPCVNRTPPNIVFKGRKSSVQVPSTLPSSVVYPFAFIKPCGFDGGVTLDDINQKIQTPPTKSKQSNEDPSVAYPTSAFSGKPVVVKTKIRTEGGKGSITIMRTKG